MQTQRARIVRAAAALVLVAGPGFSSGADESLRPLITVGRVEASPSIPPAVETRQTPPDPLPESDDELVSEELLEDPGSPAQDSLGDADVAELPAIDDIYRLVRENPAALGPLSIGTPDAGLLLNPDPLPENPLWFVRDPREAFATTETVTFIEAAVEEVERRYPGSPRLVIGDLSRTDGGKLNRHRSHQSGRDVDLGFYFLGGEPQTFLKGVVKGKPKQLDVERTWALVRALVTETDVDRIFLDRQIQRVLHAHALATGEPRAWLDDIFGRGGDKGIIQHERRHLDHMHARFFNRRAQELGRLAYPLLVQAGLLPGPTLSHRARPGETIGGLAKRYGTSAASIRSANGLRGNTIRAGRRYVIPVRRVPAAGEPIVIPPRRLPPGAMASGPGGAPSGGGGASPAASSGQD